MIGKMKKSTTSNMSLGRAIRLTGNAQLALMLLCGGTGIASAWMQSAALEKQTAVSALRFNHDMADMMHDAVRADALAAIEAADPNSGINRDDIMHDLEEHLSALKEHITADAEFKGSPEIAAVTSKLFAPMQAYAKAATDIIDQAATDPRAASHNLPAFFDQFRALETSMAAASDVIGKSAEESTNWATTFGRVAIVMLIIILALCVAAVQAFVVGAARHVKRPIEQLSGAMRQLGDGKLDIEIVGTERGDELGDMAKAMVAFRDQLCSAEAAKEEQAKLIVDSLGSGLRRLADGDLTAEVTCNLQPPFSALKQNFNTAVGSLRALIASVTDSATSIRAGSAEIAQASEDLARRTEANAATLEQTSGAILQMDERLRASADAAGRTVGRADDAMGTVADGRSIADEAVQAMTRVSESAKGIDSVIEGLDKIAFQTRVLAMNAAVEAGRAGDAGRGFAVVADLVSALAMRAEEEAGRARDQLTTTQADIGSAVDRVLRVDGALSGISSDVGEVHKLLADIAVENQAQATAIKEVSAAITAMDKATQQNAAMVEETSAAARNLTSEVAAMSAQTAQFQIDDGAGPPPVDSQPPPSRVSSRPARPAAAPPRPRPSPVSATPPPAMALDTAGGDDWTSF